MSRVEHVLAREILDSRGQPTIEVDIWLEKGYFGSAGAPSGTSTGKYEALELRDGDPKRYAGQGVRKAAQHVNQEIARLLTSGREWDQAKLDTALSELDGTASRSRLGANALLGVSLAFAEAAAQAEHRPLYEYLKRVSGSEEQFFLPTPMILVLEGGVHANRSSDIQEFMVVPRKAASFSEALRIGAEIYHALGALIREKGFGAQVGLEGAFAPELGNNARALELVLAGIERAGYTPGEEVAIAIDAAASEFFADEDYHLESERRSLSADRLIDLYEEWLKEFPIVSIEDGLAEDDWQGWQELNYRLGDKILIVGDDLFATNSARLYQGIVSGLANAVIIKPNQVGTLTETLATAGMAKDSGLAAIISHRSGETNNAAIADLAVGLSAGLCKFGAPVRGERVAKYNRLLRIEEELGPEAIFAGDRFLA